MLYEDSRKMPATADDYERDAYGATSLTGDDARGILRAHGVKGRSRMTAGEAVAMAAEKWPEEVRDVRRAKVVRYRWPVAHALRVSYAELAEIERRAGVAPLTSPGTRGAYGSAEDVARVYAEGAKFRASSHSVRVRVTAEDADDEEAAAAVLAKLREAFDCTEPEAYARRDGGRAWYFEAAVPKGKRD